MEIKNAVIESVILSRADHGCLSAWLTLDYGGSCQGFGGHALYLPKTFKHHKKESMAGHFIWRCMQIAGVENWKDLKGKTIRVKTGDGFNSLIKEIGHIVKDDWFNPEEDFKE